MSTKRRDETPTIGMYIARRIWTADKHFRDTVIFARHPALLPIFPKAKKA